MMSPKHFRPLYHSLNTLQLFHFLNKPIPAQGSLHRLWPQLELSFPHYFHALLLIFKSCVRLYFLRGAFPDHRPLKNMIPYCTVAQHPVFSVEYVPICSYYICRFSCFSLSYSLNCKLQESLTLTILFISLTPSSRSGS